MGVALVDIDRFKLVNDSLGYRAGDRLLAEVAARFTSAAPEGVLLARLGADEYLVLQPGVASCTAMVETVQDLIATLAVPIEVDEMTMALTASAGVVHLESGAVRGEDVLRWVDLAVSRAKLVGGDTIEVDVPGDHDGTSSRLQRVSQIQRGLAMGEFLPYFQGEWDLRTGALVGAEALVRWLHPTEGLLGAGDFVPLAEATGLIDQLGYRCAGRCLSRSGALGGGDRGLRAAGQRRRAATPTRRTGHRRGRGARRDGSGTRVAVPRVDREHTARRPGALEQPVRPDARPRGRPRDRRFRNRLLLDPPAQAPAPLCAQDRPAVRGRTARRSE